MVSRRFHSFLQCALLSLSLLGIFGRNTLRHCSRMTRMSTVSQQVLQKIEKQFHSLICFIHSVGRKSSQAKILPPNDFRPGTLKKFRNISPSRFFRIWPPSSPPHQSSHCSGCSPHCKNHLTRAKHKSRPIDQSESSTK
jgi:hypothetical protein